MEGRKGGRLPVKLHVQSRRGYSRVSQGDFRDAWRSMTGGSVPSGVREPAWRRRGVEGGGTRWVE